ncbi:MAG: ribosome-recycling factor [Patescibacteria group bacterium]
MTLDEFKSQGLHIIAELKNELIGVRTNRPNAGLIENIKANYYEKLTPVKQLGSISISPPRDLIMQVWDQSAIPAIAKAIESSNLGLSVSVDGNVIRIHLPQLSSERREELVKHIKKVTEGYKIQLRHKRDQANKQVQADSDSGEIGEDQKFKLKKQIQDEVDKVNAELEKLLETKIKEISE